MWHFRIMFFETVWRQVPPRMYCKKQAASKGGESEALKPLKQKSMFLFVLPLRSIPMLQAYHVRSTCSLCHQASRPVIELFVAAIVTLFVLVACLWNMYTQPIFPFHTPSAKHIFDLNWPKKTGGGACVACETTQEWFISTVHLAHRCCVQCLGGKLRLHFRRRQGPHRTSPQMVVFFLGNPLFQGNLGWWNIIIWPEWYNLGGLLSQFPKPFQVYWL